jgi:thiol-disulfide isomerase/thioredoxin
MNNPSLQEGVASEVNDRLSRAVSELQAKYESGVGGTETSVNAPTGDAYKAAQAQQIKERKAAKKASVSEGGEAKESSSGPSPVDDEEKGGDEDYELRMLREKRLKQLEVEKRKTLENLGKGHGQYREIMQDEFLSEVTGSEKVVCHFYHRDFSRCQVMHHHLQKLAPRHVEAKFININAEKAPFFVEKLKIRTMPTLIYFSDGVATGKLLGFEGLADTMPAGREDEWPTVTLARLLAKEGMILASNIVDEDRAAEDARVRMDEMRRQAIARSLHGADDDLSDFDDM